MAVPPAASSNEEGVQEIQSDVATTTPVASSGPSAEPPRARSSEEEELRASDLPEQTLQTDSDVEKPPSSPSRTAPLSRQESTSVSESAHIESASLSKAAAAVDEEEKASPFKPPVDSLKPELPSLPPQFAKDSKASDEESERDEAWDDEKPPCVPIRAPPCPPTRPAPSDTADEASSEKYAPREQELPTSSGADDAVQSGESEVQASSPPPLPAGRPTVSAEPQSSKPMEEASLQYSVAIEEASEDHDDPLTETTVPTPPTRDIPPPPPVRASDSQNQTSTPLSLETKTPSRQSSIASPTSLSRRSSRPAIPPPFSPAAAEDPVQSDSNSVKSPRMSVDNGRIAANSITESPPNSPQPGRTSSLGGESRPQSMSQPPDPPRRVSVQSTAPESHSEPGKPDLTEEGKDAEPSEVSEEQEEADRRARLAERMRKLGGQKFGMFPMMGGTQKSRQSSLQEDADAKSPTSPSAPGETPDEGPLQEKTKPAGMPRGGVAIPGLVPRPAPEAQTSQQNEEECSPSPAKQPTPSVDDEQSVSETEHEEEPQSPAVPPPLPPARPGLSLDTKSTRDVSVKEKADEVASPSVPPRPSGGHSTQASQSATSPQSEERHPFIDFGDGKKSLELQDPRTSPTVSQMPTSASSAGGFVDKVGSPAHLDQYTQSELLQFSKSYGSQVFAAAKTKSKDGTKWSGESASFNFVSAILAEVPGLEPPSGKSDFGQLIYRINSPNGTMPADDLIRLGDIVVVKQAKMRAKLGSTSIGMGSTPFVAVISDPYDAKKHKVHFLEVTKSGKVEAGGFHLDHLKEGSIEVSALVV